MSHQSWGRVTHIAQDLYIGSPPRQRTIKTRNNAKIHPLCQQQCTNNLALIQLCAEGKLAFISYFQTVSMFTELFFFRFLFWNTLKVMRNLQAHYKELVFLHLVFSLEQILPAIVSFLQWPCCVQALTTLAFLPVYGPSAEPLDSNFCIMFGVCNCKIAILV